MVSVQKTTMSRIRIGSRRSALAIKQAQILKTRIEQLDPKYSAIIITLKTVGDQDKRTPLAQMGGKGAFIKGVEMGVVESPY